VRLRVPRPKTRETVANAARRRRGRPGSGQRRGRLRALGGPHAVGGPRSDGRRAPRQLAVAVQLVREHGAGTRAAGGRGKRAAAANERC